MVRKLARQSPGLGSWRPRPGEGGPSRRPEAFREALWRLADPLYVVEHEGAPAAVSHGDARLGARPQSGEARLLGHVPPLLPEDLGDPAFRAAHGVRAAYIAGPMANGIASVEMVEAMAREGLLGIYGAAGLLPAQVEAALERLKDLGDLPWGANLIHSPDEPAIEEAVVGLFLRHGLRLVEASAYLDLTLPIVRYRTHGIHQGPDGSVVAPNRVIAKVSRAEVARKFLSPPPEHLLRALVEDGSLSEEQARLASTIPMAEDVTAEADSGGHTDNRPLVVVLPAIQALRDELHEKYRYATRPRVGAAGGIATPASAAAAFSMGAAYVVTGSINQGCLEAGTSDTVREMLAGAQSTDVAMAAAADMFEMGVKLQVLSKGTLFPVRAQRLYELYRSHESLEALPAPAKKELEEKILKTSLEEAWEGCKAFFAERDPGQIERGERDPKHRMALVFRSYLGRSSIWANTGAEDRRIDYQIWCGPAMGAFNDWTKGSFLEDWRERRVALVAQNLLHGAAALTRLAALRSQGVSLPREVETFPPMEAATLEALQRETPVSAASAAEVVEEPEKRDSGKHEPIAIVGMAALFPKASDLQGYWRLLLHGEDGVGAIPKSHFSLDDYHDEDPAAPDKTYATRGAFLDPLDFDPTEFGIPPNILEATDTSQLLALTVASQALQDAGYAPDAAWDKSRASVLLGVTGTQELVISLGARLGHPHWRKALRDAGVDEELTEEVVERIGRAYVEWQENSFPGLLGNVVAGRVANRLDLGGTNNVVDAACASSLAAVHMACMELWTGNSDLVVSGGVDTLSDIFMHMCFSKTPALSPTGDARPFSSEADGTVLGEGVGMVVLKRLSDAERDGDRIHAVIRGVGTSSDGKAKSIYAPLPAGQERALRAAYEDAGVTPDTVGLVEGHGTGTAAGDACEVEALSTVYRESIPSGAPVALGSVKGQVGHTKAAAGAAGLIKAALALEQKVLPGTLKARAPNPKLEGSPFYLPLASRPWLSASEHPRRAAVSSFGFGGSNFHVVLEEYGAERKAPAWDGAVQILAASADDEAGLRRWLGELSQVTDLGAFAARSRQTFSPAAPHRLLLVAERGADLERLAQDARKRVGAGPGSAKGVHYGVGPADGALAFLFPGQGAQSVGMLRDLANVFPELLDALETAPELAALIHPPSTFDEAEAAGQRAALTRTDKAQPALGLVELGALQILRRFGVEAELFAGHSYGELVALHAAGRFDAPTLHRVSRVRGERMAGNGADRGTMLAVHAPLAALEEILEEEDLDLVLANRNAPEQGVLSGSREAITKAKSALAERGIRTSDLQVGAAFHSPFVASAAEAFLQDLREVPFAPGKGQVIANTTAAPYPADEEEARGLLARQLAEPVRFVEVVERLYAEGARTFVEVGPRATLTGLLRATLDDRPHTAVALDASAGKRAGLADLANTLCALAAAGRPVRLEEWERLPGGEKPQRAKRMAIPLSGVNYRAPRKELPPRRAAPSRAPTEPQASFARAEAADMSKKTTSPAPVDPTFLQEALRANGETLRALQHLQEQTAAAHHRFLETQGLAQSSFHELLVGQQRLLEQAAGMPQLPGTQAPALSPAPAFTPAPAAPAFQAAPPAPAFTTAPAAPAFAPAAAPAPQAAVQATVQPVQAQPAPQAPAIQPAPTPAAAPAVAAQPAPAPAPTNRAVELEAAARAPAAQQVDVVATLLDVVAEATGYPQDMLELDMDLESDLGIDSIKRVEILSLLSKKVPGAPKVEPEQLGTVRSLRQVAELFDSAPAAPTAPAQQAAPARAAAPLAPAAAPSAPTSSTDPEETVLEVVAELTGYPQEMLELDMDLESDLGIDSIKRVEILSVLSKRIPGAPHVEPEALGDLRTLRQVLHLVAGRERAPSPTKQSKEGAADDAAEPPSFEVLPRALPQAEEKPLPAGEIWITRDEGGLAQALADAFERQGRIAKVLSGGEQGEGPVGALILLGSPLAEAFAKARALAPTLRERGALIATVSRRDGAFGRLDPTLGDPLSGGLAGLAKTLAFEWREVRTRALDVSSLLSDEEAAEAIAQELGSEGPSEVGLGPAGRIGLTLEPATPTPAAEPPLGRGDLVVVSGGGRGVTAACAVELARRTQASFLLLGRTELPDEAEPAWLAEAVDEAAVKRALLAHGEWEGRPTPKALGKASRDVLARRELRQTIARLEEVGAQAMYLAVDVRDRAQVAAAVEVARGRFGEVRGLVHGAGVLRDKRLEDKSDDDFEQVAGTKIEGLRSLLDATAADDLRVLSLFGSVSGRFGRRGQADYAMGNEALVALAHQEAAKRPGCHVTSFAWGPWEGGMVNEALAQTFESEGIGLIPTAGGASFFATKVLAARSQGLEWVVGSGWPAPARAEYPWTPRAHHRIDPETHRYLRDHQLQGKPVLPVVMMIELFARLQPGASVEAFRLLKGVIFEGAPIDLTVWSRRQAGGLEVELRGTDGRVHAKATLSGSPTTPGAAPNVPWGDLPRFERSAASVYQAGGLFHGPLFQGIEAVERLGKEGLVLTLRTSPKRSVWIEGEADVPFTTDPLLLDGIFQGMVLWCRAHYGQPSLPSQLGAWRSYVGTFPETVQVQIAIQEGSAASATADCRVLAEDGTLLAEAAGYVCVSSPTLDAAFRGAA